MADVYTRIGYIKGATGATGAQGEKGDTGAAATIQVGSVTTVPYGQTANVVNSGTEQAAVFDFTIPQGRPGQQVTEMDNLLLNSITTSAAEFPLPAVGETGKVLWGKVVKWFSDMSALVATKLNVANVVNNLTTTASGYALDARQGKMLNDKLAVSETSITVSYGTLYAKRAGNIITIHWNGNSTVAPTTGDTIGTLSAKFAPFMKTVMVIRMGTGNAGYIQINMDGAVTVMAGGSTWSAGNGAYVALNQY